MLFNKITLLSSLSLLLQSMFSSVLIFMSLYDFLNFSNIKKNRNKNPVRNINHSLYECHPERDISSLLFCLYSLGKHWLFIAVMILVRI